MTSLNRQRANIVFSTLLDSEKDLDLGPDLDLDLDSKVLLTLLTPAQVARQERIFNADGALQWTQWPTSGSGSGSATTHTLGSAQIGVSMSSFLDSVKTSTLNRLTALFQGEAYILSLCRKNKKTWHVSILLKKGCSVRDQLKAWTHGLLAARILCEDGSEIFAVIEKTLSSLNGHDRFARYLSALSGVGWDVDIAALETGGGRRVDINF